MTDQKAGLLPLPHFNDPQKQKVCQKSPAIPLYSLEHYEGCLSPSKQNRSGRPEERLADIGNSLGFLEHGCCLFGGFFPAIIVQFLTVHFPNCFLILVVPLYFPVETPAVSNSYFAPSSNFQVADLIFSKILYILSFHSKWVLPLASNH